MGSHRENARVFKALSDPKRLEILAQLRSGENQDSFSVCGK